jgi:hypothetical protein
VARFAENGDLLWIKQEPTFNSGTGTENIAIDIVADLNGCCVLSIPGGALLGQTSGVGQTTHALNGQPGMDIVISRFTKQGVLEWVSQSLMLNTAGFETASGILLGFNECYVTYTTTSTVSGGQRTGTGANIVVARFT